MHSEVYIEALLVDEDLADQVWELWDAEVTTDDLAATAWVILALGGAVAQLGERRVRNAEVGSSILLGSTNSALKVKSLLCTR